MTSMVTITAHPGNSSNNKPLKVQVRQVQHSTANEVVTIDELREGQTLTVNVWEGKSVTVSEIEDI